MKKKILIIILIALGITLISISFLSDEEIKIKKEKINYQEVKTNDNKYSFKLRDSFEKLDPKKVNENAILAYFDNRQYIAMTFFKDKKEDYQNDFKKYLEYKRKDNKRGKKILKHKSTKLKSFNKEIYYYQEKKEDIYLISYLKEVKDEFIEIVLWTHNKDNIKELDNIVLSMEVNNG